MEYVEKGPVMNIAESGESSDPPMHEEQARRYMVDMIEGMMYREFEQFLGVLLCSVGRTCF